MKLTTLNSGIDFKFVLIGFSWGIYRFSDSGTKGLDLWLHLLFLFVHVEIELPKVKTEPTKSKLIVFPGQYENNTAFDWSNKDQN